MIRICTGRASECRRRNGCYLQQLRTADDGHLKLVMARVTRCLKEKFASCVTKAVPSVPSLRSDRTCNLLSYTVESRQVTCHLQTLLFDLFMETCTDSDPDRWEDNWNMTNVIHGTWSHLILCYVIDCKMLRV